MSIEDVIRRHVERLEQRMAALAMSIVDFAPITRTSAAGDSDGVNVQGDPKDRERPIRRVSPWGISGRPIAGDNVIAAIVKAVASSFGGMSVGVATDKYGPQDLEEGETCIWNKQTGCRILLDKDGKITIDAPAGQDVVVNGGTEKVARTNDTLTASAAFKTWAAAVDSGIPTNTPPPTPFATAAGIAGGMGDIETGAARFKA